jgi:hypothetical protein
MAVVASDTLAYVAPAPLRETAADRPGVAQPVPLRPVPVQPWNRIFLGMLVLFALLLGAWEWHWRAFGVKPEIMSTDGLWSIQRRRIDAGEGNATVLVGDSRIFFDVQLPAWEKLDGQRPIQLAYEGTSAIPFMEDLAADPNFTGRLLIGVAPDVFFSTHLRHAATLKYFRKESPSQRLGQWLSMHFIEPFFAFDDPDFALATVLQRQPWPGRPGKRDFIEVRKLAVTEADRNTHLWEKVDADPDYHALALKIWMQRFEPSPNDLPAEKQQQVEKEQIARAAKAVATLRARGVKVLFVRPPSNGPYLDFENHKYPRAATWDALLAATGAPGIHFEDYPELQGFELPENSHVKAAEADRFTLALWTIIHRDFWKDATAH